MPSHPACGECLLKTDISIELPEGCSHLDLVYHLKHHPSVQADAIDYDYFLLCAEEKGKGFRYIGFGK